MAAGGCQVQPTLLFPCGLWAAQRVSPDVVHVVFLRHGVG